MAYDYDHDYFRQELKPHRHGERGHSQWSWSKSPASLSQKILQISFE